MRKPKWFTTEETTRSRSCKQESKIAKELKGRVTINSGATFGQNDVITDYAEVEAKTTTKQSYSLKVSDWEKLVKKAEVAKIPLMSIDFEKDGLSLAVISWDDLLYLISKANS